MKKPRVPEILLAIVIFASAGYIGWKLLAKDTVNTPVASQAPPPIQDLPVVAPQVDVPVDYTVVDGGEYIGRPLGSAEMDALRAARFESASQSPACGSQAPQKAFAFQQPALAEAIAAGRMNFFMGDRDSRCYKVGTRMQILLFDMTDASQKFAVVFGSVEIKHIFWGPSEKIPDAIFAAIEVTRGAYRLLFPGAAQETLAFFGDFRPGAEGDQTVLPLFPRTQKISIRSLESVKAKYPGLVVVDVRSADEARSKPVSGAVAVEAKVGQSLRSKTFFTASRSELLAGVLFDESAFLKAVEPTAGKALVIVGGDEQDMSVTPLVLKTIQMQFANVFWLPMGFDE